jgi:hypothetical protein
MNKLITIIIGLIFSLTGFSQSCLPDGIIFSSQAEIDNFQVSFPGCSEIEGNVAIVGNDITNLNGLGVITHIGGYLQIGATDELISLRGLDSLISIGSELYITCNDALTSLTGLEGLTSIGSDLSIICNYALTSLTGLDNLNAASISNLAIYSDTSLSDCAI